MPYYKGALSEGPGIPTHLQFSQESAEADGAAFREAMSHLPAAVSIVATDGPAGRYGITLSSIVSVSDAPPTISFYIARRAYVNQVIKQNRQVSVNLLNRNHTGLAGVFARPRRCETGDLFAPALWQLSAGLPPSLIDARATLSATVQRTIEIATHTLMICYVKQILFGRDELPSLYFKRQFTTIKHGEDT
ncbi:flavin reductase family protein [Gluconacetobacter sacchari]|uniref:Flavin reductase n=1 Tax=Gluconacetobacter sacchari TaxID=92759 RepID=A0A7W4IH69_9PROT|nr:flavin reductase family protein [Gluconacetobacter sacchari]MBB2162790.1 flavin reductase [Gluconacetobacter sacchari]